MKLLIAIAIISFISILGSRLTFLDRRIPMGFQNILLTGTEYIFLGIILGKMGLNILDTPTLQKIEPILLFGLCWIGFLYGLQFEVKLLQNLPRYYFTITAIQAIITFLVVTISLFFILNIFLKENNVLIFTAAITLGSAACCTAQSAIAIAGQTYKLKNRGLLELLRYISSVDGLYGLAFFAFSLCILPVKQVEVFFWINSVKWIFTSLVIGIVPALILIALSRFKFTQQEFLLFLTGTIMFSAGIASTLDHSPLITGLINGIIMANFCRHRVRALSTVAHAEKSIYIILLLLIGANWNFRFDYSLVVLIFYFFVRVLGKLAGSFMATNIFKPQYYVPPYFGLGLISEGGLAIAIIFNFTLLHSHPIADSMVTIIVLSVLLSELAGPGCISLLFREKRGNS